MTLQEFYDLCNRHDWFYDYSDDGRVVRAGRSSLEILQSAAMESPAHQAILDGFHRHMFSGMAWNTEKVPKPERPA